MIAQTSREALTTPSLEPLHADQLDCSAIICVHNGERFLPGLFRRLASMRCERFEVILVEDGSTDRTHELMIEFERHHPAAWIIRNPGHLGLSESRNRAVAHASRQFVWIADVDDDWDTDILDVLAAAVTNSRADAAICDAALVVDGHPRGVIGGRLSPGIITGPQAVILAHLGSIRGYTWNKLIARRILAQTPFAPVTMYTDFSAITAALLECETIVLLDKPLYRHHTNIGSVSRGPFNDIDALRTCLHTAQRLGAQVPAVRHRPGLTAFFEAWFFLIPMASASAAGTAGDAYGRVGIAEARQRLRENGLSHLFAYSLVTWARAMAVVCLGRHYRAVHLAALRARRPLRTAGRFVRQDHRARIN